MAFYHGISSLKSVGCARGTPAAVFDERAYCRTDDVMNTSVKIQGKASSSGDRLWGLKCPTGSSGPTEGSLSSFSEAVVDDDDASGEYCSRGDCHQLRERDWMDDCQAMSIYWWGCCQ